MPDHIWFQLAVPLLPGMHGASLVCWVAVVSFGSCSGSFRAEGVYPCLALLSWRSFGFVVVSLKFRCGFAGLLLASTKLQSIFQFVRIKI